MTCVQSKIVRLQPSRYNEDGGRVARRTNLDLHNWGIKAYVIFMFTFLCSHSFLGFSGFLPPQHMTVGGMSKLKCPMVWMSVYMWVFKAPCSEQASSTHFSRDRLWFHSQFTFSRGRNTMNALSRRQQWWDAKTITSIMLFQYFF